MGTFDYSKEEVRDILMIDCKSFYASCECVERGLNPLTAMLVVGSHSEEHPGSGLVLAASPTAKRILGISNVTRMRDIPTFLGLIIAPPQMRL
jgi:DNA polymerase V